MAGHPDRSVRGTTMHYCTDEKKPTGDGHPTAGSTDRAIVSTALGTSKKLPIRAAGMHLLLALNDTLNHATLRAWCAAPSCWGRGTIRSKAKAPVRSNTTSEAVAAPTEKRGFVSSKFLALVRLHWCRTVSGGMGLPARMAARLRTCLKHPVHLMRAQTQTVALVTPEGAKTMTTFQLASRRAAPTPTPTTGNHDPIQLFADAHNALAMASYYLRQPEANHAGAARKAGQALAALRRLAALQEGGAA